MPSLDHAGTTLFLKRWLRRPLAMGAVVPSGRLLAEAMAETTKAVLADRPGHVVELGAGTGEVTKALLAAGIPAERLALVERDPELARFLRGHFPAGAGRPRIIEGDAARLPRLLAEHDVAPVAAAVAVVVAEAETPLASGEREAAFLLTKRTPRLRSHGGQWALLGGRVDPV